MGSVEGRVPSNGGLGRLRAQSVTSCAPVERHAWEANDLACRAEFEGRLQASIALLAVERELSGQEARLLCSAALGHCDKVAAEFLGVSPNTISSYWRRIYWKLDVQGSREALGVVIRWVLSQDDKARATQVMNPMT